MKGEDRFDPYLILGVDATASPEEIRRQYRRLALQHHPDKAPEPERAEASARFQEISRAYEILSDDDRRRAWDRTGSTEGFHFEDPLEVFRTMWEVLEDAGFLQSFSIPMVSAHVLSGPEAEMAFRMFQVMPMSMSMCVEELPRMEEAIPRWVSQQIPTDWAGGRADEWAQQQGRTLGQWADAFLQRATTAATVTRSPTRGAGQVPARRVTLQAPADDVWKGVRRRIRFDRKKRDGTVEKATCVVPLRLPGLVLEGAGDDGGALEIHVQATPSANGGWMHIPPYDLLHVVGVDSVERIWKTGAVLEVQLPDGRMLSVRIPAGHPTQLWRGPLEGFVHLDEQGIETRGHLRLFLRPEEDVERQIPCREGDVAEAVVQATPLGPSEWSTAQSSENSKVISPERTERRGHIPSVP